MMIEDDYSFFLKDRHITRDFAKNVLDHVKQSMYGLDEVTRLCLVSLYTNGHILLEGNPGLGKTFLVKTLGQVLTLDFSRIQFTPDLMPTDIIGTQMPGKMGEDQTFEFTFQPGPVFTNLLLADEINRATPKTQSALLEAMAERQVTVSGKLYPIRPREFVQNNHDLSDGPVPFMVLATQNPIDHEGTYQLPEAQSDRFMFKILMPVPDGEVLTQIMAKDAGVTARADEETSKSQNGDIFDEFEQSLRTYRGLRQAIRQVRPDPNVQAHIQNLFLATNNRLEKGDTISDRKKLQDLTDLLEYGLGPRAATALMLGAKAWTLLFIDGELVVNSQALAKVIIPTLRHRIKLKYDWYDQYHENHPDVPDDRLLDWYLYDLCEACAPTEGGFASEQADFFKKILKETVEKMVY